MTLLIDGEPHAPLTTTTPTAWQRARGAIRGRDPVVGWCATVLITVAAFVLRLWHLGTPRTFEFDETYYAKDAWSLLHFGYARDYIDGANEKILDGTLTGVWKETPEMIVHPEVGKWLIALGEKVFGMDPTGWRMAPAIAGALLVMVVIRLTRRLSGSTLLGCLAGVLLCFDGLEFVLSRLALLDIFLALFTLAAVSCMVADRDWYRGRLAARLEAPIEAARSWGPLVLWRPWLLASGLLWGLACGTKWTAMYPLAAFGIMVWIWSAGARRSFGVRLALLKAAITDGLPAVLYLVVVAFVVYVATWGGWLAHADVYEANLSSTQYTQYTGHGHCGGDKNETYISDDPDTSAKWPTATEPDASGLGEITQSLRSLWYYHEDVWTFHTHFLNCATHTYASNPAGWLLLNRPVGVAADTGIQPGVSSEGETCTAPQGSDCLRQVLLLGTPVLWWGGVLALVFACVMWILKRDWRFGVAVVGVASTWLPWFQYDDRPIFSYYAIVCLPFTVVALALTLGTIIGPATVGRRRTVGTAIAGIFTILVVANFAWFWPIYTNALLTHSQWLDRIWFSRWI
ncbi:dolichyl-phosphate-mannose--protein mannosyltransferase [Nocardioides sp. Kera G14]|uniref:dolichyl-phosphate-mannose--protein mannosyltransferase n=1 Tax=Nocardioides sp. Kera G14 TaxID=2884264 RepID=UPI001D117D68|nr:phospholipid carrier-dependent glycosyltransferase [Nocardioides sp. Kera G14]UDY24125.1 phospholipid carrier-dependent glycosyltransferase [Nocardioides sp. Kera G14]